MKKLLYLILIFPIFSQFLGCYTVLWHPAMDTKEIKSYREEVNYENESFYETRYFGSYNNFYDIPWWWSINLPYFGEDFLQDNVSEDGNNNSSIRNNDSNRRESNPRETNFQVPSRNSSSGNSSTQTGSPTKENRKSTENENTEESRKKSDDSNREIRNNDGNRSTEKPRR